MTDRKIDLPEGVPPLTTYYVYLTGGCNLACKHCWITPTFHPNGGTGGHLDFELFKLAIEEGLPLGLQSVKLTGGEPLLHPDFIKIVDHTTSNHLKLWMETNGTLISRDLAFYLKNKTTMSAISVSVDGATAETHEQNRNVRGCFDQSLSGIKHLVDAGFNPQIILSLTKDNVDEIEPLAFWAQAHGCRSLKINLISPVGRGQQMQSKGDLLSVERLVQIGEWVTKELQPKLNMPIFYSWPTAMWSTSDLLTKNPHLCQIHNILGILSDGQISICGIGVTEPDLVFGTIGVDKIDTIWINSPVLKSIRSAIPYGLTGICAQCIHKYDCLGACSANTYHINKNFTTSYWFCDEAMRQGLFPLSRLSEPILE